MNIIFIAPPAAGKGTQSELICSKYNITHISTGDLIRETINNNDENSNKLKSIIEQGKLVSDEFILQLITNKINNNNDFIFDGFPRNLKQAELFDELLYKLNKKVDLVFYLKIDKSITEKRIVGRLSCPSCGRVYNDQIIESMPKQTGLCDTCNIELTKRSDDNLETFSKRFDTYMNETSPVIDYYKNKNILFEIDSNLDKYEIFNQIEKVIDNYDKD